MLTMRFFAIKRSSSVVCFYIQKRVKCSQVRKSLLKIVAKRTWPFFKQITPACGKNLLESSESQDSPSNLLINPVAQFSTEMAQAGLEFKNGPFYRSLILNEKSDVEGR